MKRHLGIIALIFAQLISGINNPLIRYALGTMPIYLFGFLRVGIALVVIAPIALHSRNKRPPHKRAIKPHNMLLVIIGTGLVYCVANLSFYAGIHQSTSINSAVIELLHPILFFMVTIEVLREKFNGKIFIGILVAFVGALVVVLGPLLGHSTSGGTLIGNMLLFTALVADVAGTAILKRVLKKVHILDVLAVGLGVATVFYGILALPQMTQLSLLSQPAIFWPVLYGAIMNGCVGYGLAYFGLAVTKGSDYSIIGYVTPLATMTVAVVFFSETFTASLVLGGAIVFFGLYLVEARNMFHLHARARSLHR